MTVRAFQTTANAKQETAAFEVIVDPITSQFDAIAVQRYDHLKY
jgi:hypothetical protein